MKDKKRIVDLPGVFLKDQEGTLDYKIVVLNEDDKEKFFLCAVGPEWTSHIENTVIFKITDTGNEIIIGKKYLSSLTSSDENGMEYHTAEYLRILLNYRDSTSHMPSKYTIVRETEHKI